jgi:hypothetical protein
MSTHPRTAHLAAGGFGAFALSIPLAGAFAPGYSHVREGISALAATVPRPPQS